MRRLASWLLTALSALPLAAQDPAAAAQDPAAAPAAIQKRIDELTTDESLAADAKTTALEALRRALESAKHLETLRASLQTAAAAKASAPDRLASRQAELTALEGNKPGPARPDLPLVDLEQGFATAQQAQTLAQQQAADLDKETARRAERRAAVPTRIAELQKRLGALPQSLPDAPEVDSRVRSAQRLALQQERLELEAEIAAAQAELQTYDAETELLRTERDLAARRVTAAKADADAWLLPLQAARAAAAQRAEQEARLAQLAADPRVKKLADANAGLAAEIARLGETRDRVERDRLSRVAELARLQQDFDEVKRRTELVGATDAIGALLRQRRMQLAQVARINQQESRSRSESIADAQLRSLEFDERRRRLVEDPDAWLVAELGGVEIVRDLPPFVLEEARRLRDARRDLLRQLTEGYASLLVTQIDLASAERQLTALIAGYRTYVTERVLGIRSSKPIWQYDFAATLAAAEWFARPSHWADFAVVAYGVLIAPAWPLLVALVLTVLFGMRRTLVGRLQAHGELAARGSTVAYLPTALAALDTLLLATPLPTALWFVGTMLLGAPESTEFVKAVAIGLQHTGWALLLVTVLAQVVRVKGLAEAHFQWQTTTIARLRANLPLLLLSVLPFVLLLGAIEAPGDDSWLGSVGALLLAGQLAVLLTVFWRLLHPSTGIVGGAGQTVNPAVHRLRRLWFLLGVGTPLLLLVMVVLGYEYTALQLARRLHLTFGAVLVAVLVQAMILRGLLLERRRLQLRHMQERLAAAKAGELPAGADTGAAGADPGSLARQTQTLVRGAVTVAAAVATFQIWIDVLPALGLLRRVELWSTLAADGTASAITLADLLLAGFVLLAAGAAARNLPALLELLVLQRLRMQAGERHAISTLARYGILIVGGVLAFGAIGIGWSKIQWLVAAVSLGLGFGLQEIFANFVSGLILLVERPIRVGDIVQIGETIGRVARIQIRATTIQDWDRKELVVPNREFVTSRFVNWTLSDGVVRWVVPVGIAYGSDTERALELLTAAAKRSRFVRDTPPVEAVMVAFGASTIDLNLRIFIDMNTLEPRWLTDLLQDIDRSFREAGIAIAFPQQDVHLDLSEPVLGLLRGLQRPASPS